MTTLVTLIRCSRRWGEIEGLPAKTESCLRLPPFAQCAAVSTLVGAIREPLQISRRFCSSATVNCQPAAFALPPPVIRGVRSAPTASGDPATTAKQSSTAGNPSPRRGAGSLALVPLKGAVAVPHEVECRLSLIVRREQVGVAKLGAPEAGRVPELARDLGRPGTHIEIGLGMVLVSG